MIPFSSFPLFRHAICFALGIVVCHYLGEHVFFQWPILAIAFSLYLYLHLKRSFKKQYVLALLTFYMLFGLGALRLSSFKGLQSSDHLANNQEVLKGYKARITEVPEAKEKSLHVTLEVYEVLIDNEWEKRKGLINAYLDLGKGLHLAYGDLLFVKGNPVKTRAPANPGEFNYQSYLTYNRIHHQHFVGEEFNVIGYKPANLLLEISAKLRQKSTDIIGSLISDQKAKGVALALVLGVKDDLDRDVSQAFSASGAMHVLAVSGLHVGIIYALVFFLLKTIGLSNRKYRWWLAGLSMLALWAYAVLTGLSPSVLRAVTMFSFVAAGQALARKSNIYNTLSASALVLLIYNPYLIMSVGFQLSYLAVFGIVYIQPRLYSLFETSNWLLDKIWAITCVSIAAQLATAPLSMLYFHQFPSYFLLSNLFVIPAAFVILISGLLLLLSSWIPIVSAALGWLLTQFIIGVNALVFWMGDLPGSVIDGVYLSILDTWLMYALIMSFTLFLVQKRFMFLRRSLLFSIGFTLSQLWHHAQYANTNEFSVMDISSSHVFDLRSGFRSLMIADSTFNRDQKAQRFHLYPKRLLARSKQNPNNDRLKVHQIETPIGDVLVFDGKTILYLNQKVGALSNSTSVINVDWLILGRNALDDLNQLKETVRFEQVIIDSTNSWYNDQQLVLQADALKINYHSIRQDGYFSKRWKKRNL